MKRQFFNWVIILLAISTFVAFSSTSVLFADELGDDLGPEWGTADFVSYSKHNSDFKGIGDTNDSLIRFWEDWNMIYCVDDCRLTTGLQLPQGARIIGWRIDCYGGVEDANVSLALQECDYNSYSCSNIASPISVSGEGFLHATRSCSHTVNNYHNYYRFWLNLPSTSTFEGWLLGASFIGGVVYYQLQISQAPSSATFWDVPTTHPFFRHIEALAKSGITSGCGGGAYCPDQPVTRGQMAVFLAKALGLHWEYPY